MHLDEIIGWIDQAFGPETLENYRTDLQADVIIKQHAPYAVPESDAVPEPDADLLELEDEENPDDSFILDSSEVELSSETLIQEIVKDESEMEEPVLSASETPTSESRYLIQNFLKGDPGPIRADRKATLKGDASRSSIREHDGFIQIHWQRSM